MRLAFIGTGSMGSALLAGVIAGGCDPADIIATTHSAASARALAAEHGIRTIAVAEDSAANRRAASGADYVFLGVKPWAIKDTAAEVGAELGAEAVLVSMAAGITLEQLAASAGHEAVVRIMPNTPSRIGCGVISVSPAEAVAAAQVAPLTALLAGAGQVFELDEELIPAMTGISGSGVAYFFLLAEEMVRAGTAMGLDAETAAAMVVKTAEGAGRLLAADPDPAALRQAVTSKGGTTHAAITTFQDAGFAALVERAAQAAGQRAIAMAEEY
ncbi:pyrroline-5-carboxylate reductase [Brevibacterium otitidis]|uniref:Pyrroline-5-carboxylate reductase n=1 Tax=Brevibacterium otitidis TaxID=53364 RepID=A0ABV5X5Z8_9MICO|nr:pyrroline-5-carboxylate reductase [Brevibacterium otitidis]